MNLTLPQMRMVATGALVVCVIGMVLCRWFEQEYPVLAWARAFFEAATVGALADWFAVVALFRHPMGIPLKHTAILPNNKGRVAESLANFLETSFLTEQQLGPRFRKIDYAAFLSEWLEKNAAMVAEKSVQFAPKVVGGFSDDEFARLLGERAREMIGKAELGPMAAGGLEVIVKDGRDREIFVSVLKSAHQLIEEHRVTIQSKISKEIPISGDMLRNLPLGRDLVGSMLDQIRESLASLVAEKTIQKVQAALDEAATEPDSELWKSFDQRLRKLIDDLKTSPEMAQRVRTMQEKLAGSGMLDDFAARTWSEIKEFILRDCEAPGSTIRRKIEEGIRSAAGHLVESDSTKTEINKFIGEHVLENILAARPHVRELVVSTINAWDAEVMSSRLEETVGRDLQYIRLNGTGVGGLIGLIIHAVFFLFGN